MSKETLKLALEALKHTHPSPLTSFYTIGDRDKAIKAIEEHLAQPERHELQAEGKHPAPCARFCEANAFQIEIRRLKAQLAQPEQEPVAWGVDWGKDGQQSCVSIVKRKPNDGIEVVAIEYNPTPSPPQRKPLTDEQIVARAMHLSGLGTHPDVVQFARAIEAAHGIKEKNNG